MEVTKIRSKKIVYKLFLIFIIGLYFSYYVDPDSFTNRFSILVEKVEIINSQLSPKIEGQVILQDFSSKEELVFFLRLDKTNENIYSYPNYVCHHFTETLIRNAHEEGYRIEYLGIYGNDLKDYENAYISFLSQKGIISTWGEGEGHAICVAYIGDKKILIEPQTDVFFEVKNGRYIGLYMGEY